MTVGAAAGSPLAEWAYVTPGRPDGLLASELQWVAAEEQTATCHFWFLSNYEPFINDGRWFSLDDGNAGLDQAPFAPNRWPPDVLLSEEFGEALPFDVLHAVAQRLMAHADLWMVRPDVPLDLLALAQPKRSTVEGREDVLARLERVEQALAALTGGIGHNQGPAILEPLALAEVRDAVPAAKAGVAEGADGKGSVEGTRQKLAEAMTTVGGWLAKGAVEGGGRKVGEAAYQALAPSAIRLFHALHEALVALGQWLATLVL